MFKKIFEWFNLVPEEKNVLHIVANISLSDRIKRGKYDWVNGNITHKNFEGKILKNYNVEYKLFHFDYLISSDDAIRKMKEEGYSAGNIMELLCIGETQPELQREFPIVALGSSVALSSSWFYWDWKNAFFHTVYLYRDGMRRELRLGWLQDGWYWCNSCRFLGVRRK